MINKTKCLLAASLLTFTSSIASHAACSSAQLEAHGAYTGRWESKSLDGWAGGIRLQFRGKNVVLQTSTDTSPNGKGLQDWTVIRTSEYQIRQNGNIYFTYRSKRGAGKSVFAISSDCSRMNGLTTNGKGQRLSSTLN